jgi:hypothetical protein
MHESATTESKSRVVVLSSKAQTLFAPAIGIDFDNLDGVKGYNPWVKYKLAYLLFAFHINQGSSKGI